MSEDIRIVIPTYNERDNLEVLIPRLFEVFEEKKMEADVLVIDDNSPDGTAKLLRSLSDQYQVGVIEREEKSGLGSAYVRGFKKSLNEGKDIIFEMDGDLSHDPEYIPEFIERIEEGYDVVIGEREDVVGWGGYRKLISWGGNLIGKILAGVKVNDLTTGYRAYKREVLKEIDLDEIKSEGYAFQLEMLAKSLDKDFRIGSVPITFYERESGDSKLSRWDIFEFFKIAFLIRLRK